MRATSSSLILKWPEWFIFPKPSSLFALLVARLHKRMKQWMRLQRLRLELRMKLAAQKKRMLGLRKFHNLHIGRIGSRPGQLQTASDQGRFVPVSYTHLRAHETGRNLVCRL